MDLPLINSTLIPKKSFSRPSTGKIIPGTSLGQKQNPSNRLDPRSKTGQPSILENLYNRPKPKHKTLAEVKGWFGGSAKPLTEKPTNKKPTTSVEPKRLTRKIFEENSRTQKLTVEERALASKIAEKRGLGGYGMRPEQIKATLKELKTNRAKNNLTTSRFQKIQKVFGEK